MTRRRGRSGDEEIPGRVHGAWTTPAVVVRRPDGSIVQGGERAERGAPGPTPGRRRVRPRRIPGAPGAVLLAPTLSDAGDGAEGRRLRRNSGTTASVSPLPPRPPADVPPPTRPPDVAAGDEQQSSDGGRPARPPLAVVGAAFQCSGVAKAVRGIDLGRLLPDDPEARAERLARLRRVGLRAAAVAVAAAMVYTVFPVRTALNLWAAEDRARERQAAFERENEILEEEIADLQRDERIEVEAREQGMVLPGEESYGIMPAPAAPGAGASTSTTVPQTTSTTRPAG